MSSSKNARFCFNNFIESGTITTSSAESNFPTSNLVGGVRSKVWKASGIFEIGSTNNKAYINSTTYTLTAGTYSVSSLITHFNSVTGQTLSRNSLGRFVITLGSSGTLNLSTTTNAVWSTLGFLSSSDLTGTAFTADERRYNNGEWIKTDTLLPTAVTFAALIPPSETAFSCTTATIKLQGNNVDLWTSPIVDMEMEVGDSGAFVATTIDTINPCRYWRILIQDYKNPAISAAVVYMGDSVTTDNTNVQIGFTRSFKDTSNRLFSEGGQMYVDTKYRYTLIESLSILYLKDDDLEAIENLYYDLRQGRPFFIVLDPQEQVSRALSQFTFYVEVSSDPNFSHVISGYHNFSFSLKEVI